MKLAKQYVTLMRYSDQYDQSHAQCLDSANTIPPESLLASNPNRFYGIKPDSPLWPQVVAAYKAYYEELCQHPTKDEFLDALAQTYANELSTAELAEAIRFYSSSTGSHVIAAHRSAGKRVSRLWSQWSTKQVLVADRNFDRRLRKLATSTGAK